MHIKKAIVMWVFDTTQIKIDENDVNLHFNSFRGTIETTVKIGE
jgi:hypothetical protein